MKQSSNELRIPLFRFQRKKDANSDSDVINNNKLRTTPLRQRYRRKNCGSCKGCLADDCLSCRVCVSAVQATKTVRRRHCLRKTCSRPILPKNALCLICRSKSPPNFVDAGVFPTTHSDLAECGLCEKVVHPACLIRKYNLAADWECLFYPQLFNAWDCILCNLGVEEIKEVMTASPSYLSSSSSSSSSPSSSSSSSSSSPFSSPPPSISSTSKNLRAPPNIEKPKSFASHVPLDGRASVVKGERILNDPPILSEADERICELCARNDLVDSLMTCTQCARTKHDVCEYAQRRSDPRFANLSGVRNCLDPKFWECPSCLWGRGVRDDNWIETGILDDATKTKTVKEKTIDMFSPQTGNIVVTHYAFCDDLIGETISVEPSPFLSSAPPDEVECFMDVEDPELTAEIKREMINGKEASPLPEVRGSGDAVDVPREPLMVRNIVPMTTIKCDYCSRSDLSSEDALRSHVTAQHPRCGHCPQNLHFQDIPKILSHFKAEHKNLKRCKVLIANETLILAMSGSFHG